MSNTPTYIKVNGRVYRRADTIGPQEIEMLEKLYYKWLSSGRTPWRTVFSGFSNWPTEALAKRMAEEFASHVGSLVEDALPWEKYARQIKSEKEE